MTRFDLDPKTVKEALGAYFLGITLEAPGRAFLEGNSIRISNKGVLRLIWVYFLYGLEALRRTFLRGIHRII